METADIWLRDAELIHALRDSKTSRGGALPVEVWRNISNLLDEAAPYWDTLDEGLIYVINVGDDVGKVVVRVNFTSKVRAGGQRNRLTSNFIRTGGVLKAENIQNDARYIELEK